MARTFEKALRGITHPKDEEYVKTELLTRDEFAKRVGLSSAEVERRAARGTLVPAFRSSGIPFYTSGQVEEIERVGARLRSKGEGRWKRVDSFNLGFFDEPHYKASHTKKVFPLLMKGWKEDAIVRRTGVNPAIVHAIAEDHTKLTRGLTISQEIKEQIEALPLDGQFPLETAEELLDILKRCASEVCIYCKKRSKSACKQCVADMVEQNAFVTANTQKKVMEEMQRDLLTHRRMGRKR
jgi:uncharacterized small protein (DUF1192 family)